MFGIHKLSALYFISGVILGLLLCVLFRGNAYASGKRFTNLNAATQDSPKSRNLGNTVDDVIIEPEAIRDKHLWDSMAHEGDAGLSKDGTSAAVGYDLYDKVRVLCWIQTYEGNLWSKAIHVKNTWAKRCNKVLFMSDTNDTSFPAIGLGTELGRKYLIAKAKKAFDYIYKYHFDDADWFMKADPDTYVIMENMRYFLSGESPSEAHFFGYPYKAIVETGYVAGGPSYVWSKEALRRFGTRGNKTCPWDEGSEDVGTGRCMGRLNVTLGDTRDNLNRTRFHVFGPNTHIHGGYPKWYYPWSRYPPEKGIGNMSYHTVSFHYVAGEHMYELEYLVYNTSVHGRQDVAQDLNYARER